MQTQAEIFVGRDAQGDNFEFLDRLDTVDVSERNFDSEYTIYLFLDGSRIVAAGAGWDFGVHETRLENPETLRRYEGPTDPDGRDGDGLTLGPLDTAWVGAGYGLTEADAYQI